MTARRLAPILAADVRVWHFSDVAGRPYDVRSRAKIGSGLPTAKMARLTLTGHATTWMCVEKSLTLGLRGSGHNRQ